MPLASLDSTNRGRRVASGSYGLLAALAAAAVIVIYGTLRTFPTSTPQAPETRREGAPVVAVLPFTSAGLADESMFFANGMHDDLLTQLAQLQSLCG